MAPPKEPPTNQAILVREDDKTYQALRLLDHSLGIIVVGKRLVLIEGQSASVDKQVYGSLLKNRYPGLVLVPSGGKRVITQLAVLNRAILKRTLWGIEFFLLCDRDAVPLLRPDDQLEKVAGARLLVLGQYHIENYFLESAAICRVFGQMEPEDSRLRSATEVEARLRQVARSIISYAVALAAATEFRDRVGNLDVMPDGVHEKTIDDLVLLLLARIDFGKRRITMAEESEVEVWVCTLFKEFEDSLTLRSDRLRIIPPGKPILSRFAALTRLDVSRLKTMHIPTAEVSGSTFREIDDIFSSFAAFVALS